MLRILYIVTVPLTALVLMRGHLRYMREQGHEVILISSPGMELDQVAERDGIRVIGVPMSREISLLRDIVSLLQLVRYLWLLKPDIVNAGTPKAGFLGMLASTLCGVPTRIYWLRGLRMETLTGIKRKVSVWAERIAGGLATYVVPVSRSLAATTVELGITDAAKIRMMCGGSSNGVQEKRFLAVAQDTDATQDLRRKLGIPTSAKVFGFVGRLTRDKGVGEALASFNKVLATLPDTRLLILGDFEPGDPVCSKIHEEIKTHPQIVHAGFVSDTAPYYPLMEVMVFPSYREGFPNVILEAALAGTPTVGFLSTGVMDAIVDNVTGYLVKRFDTDALANALLRLLQNEELRKKMAKAGRERALRDFRPEAIWQAWDQLYKSGSIKGHE